MVTSRTDDILTFLSPKNVYVLSKWMTRWMDGSMDDGGGGGKRGRRKECG